MPITVRGVISWAATLALLAAMIVATVYLETWPDETFSGRARAVDGDSLELRGQRLRLLGIDAPELDQTCRQAGKTTRCGRRAHAELRALVSGKTIECERFGTDRYNRALARCRAGETDLGLAMVRAGWAISYGDYRSEERKARRAKAGLWAGEFVEPADWRLQQGRAAADFRFWQRWF